MIRAKINDLDKNINEIVGNLNILIENIKSDTHREVNCVVEKYYTDINKHNSEEILKKINAEIAENISKVIELSILKVFESFR
jgi:predicted transcriptional regulator